MTNITQETPSIEQVTKSYEAALDSVTLINGTKPVGFSDEDWADCIKRNVEHLQIQVDKGANYYGIHDLTPFQDAINTGNTFLAK